MRLFKNLKYLRKINNITQQELANIIEIKKSKVIALESNKKYSITDIEKICVLFMTNSSDLCFGSVRKCKPYLKDFSKETKKDKKTMESVMQSFKIIKNYGKMQDALHEIDPNINSELGISK